MGVDTARLWRWTGYGRQTLWDWMQLSATASIPIVIAVGGLLFNSAQNERNKEVEQRRAQDEALQSYLGEMSDLLADEGFREYLLEEQSARDSERNAEAELQRTVAQARTLTILRRLGAESDYTALGRSDEERPGVSTAAQLLGSAERKGRVLEFLYQAGLITNGKTVINLDGADLEDVKLPFEADLSDADLSDAILMNASLNRADLTNANLSGARLNNSDLTAAYLTKAYLTGTDLDGAMLPGADLSEANGLDPDRLPRAIGDERTQLPGVTRPDEWYMSLSEQQDRK